MRPHVPAWHEASHFPSELLALEELARVDGSVALTVCAHTSLCTNHIYRFGDEEQRRRYVPALARGEKLGCWSLTEPEAGSNAGGTRSVARRHDGGWVLDGQRRSPPTAG